VIFTVKDCKTGIFAGKKKPAGTFRASRHFIFISGIYKCRPALSRMTGILAISKCQPGVTAKTALSPVLRFPAILEKDAFLTLSGISVSFQQCDF
jgi:hypothetical protein